MQIVVQSDFDGYFEGLAKQIVSYAKSPKYTKLIVTAGPYRADALSIHQVDADTVRLDFYSALRNGFGRLTDSDLREAAKLI